MKYNPIKCVSQKEGEKLQYQLQPNLLSTLHFWGLEKACICSPWPSEFHKAIRLPALAQWKSHCHARKLRHNGGSNRTSLLASYGSLTNGNRRTSMPDKCFWDAIPLLPSLQPSLSILMQQSYKLYTPNYRLKMVEIVVCYDSLEKIIWMLLQ